MMTACEAHGPRSTDSTVSAADSNTGSAAENKAANGGSSGGPAARAATPRPGGELPRVGRGAHQRVSAGEECGPGGEAGDPDEDVEAEGGAFEQQVAGHG